MDHHFVPQFYLRQWTDADGRIPSYRWLNGRAVFSHIRSTKGTGYERDLYAQEHVAPEDRQKVETDFFGRLDDRAALIHGKLMRQERFTLTIEERHDWAVFLAAANARTPDIVNHAKMTATEELRKKLLDNPEELERALGHKPDFTLLEWAEKNTPATIANFGLSILLKNMVREDLIQQFMDMDWTVHRVRSRHKELLTCDRPLWYMENPKHPKFTMMMTLCPRTVFIAAKNPDLADKIAAAPSMKLARLINESVFNRAAERIYGRTTLEYAQRCFSLTRKTRRRA